MASATQNDSLQLLTFQLAKEVYGIDVFRTREVLDFEKITQLPNSPEYMRGVINLRGKVVPVIDLRMRFGLPPTEKTINTCIVVLEVQLKGSLVVLGIMADSVQEVIELNLDHIEPPPQLGTALQTHFIQGMGKRDEQFIIILDIDEIFSDSELESMHAVSEN